MRNDESNRTPRSNDLCLFGAALVSGNRGVAALAHSLTTVLMRTFPDLRIVLMIPTEDTSPQVSEIDGKQVVLEVMNYRLNPKAGLKVNIVYLYLLSIFYRLCPIGSWKTAIVKNTPWFKTLTEASMVGDIRGGDSFSDIYGMKRFLLGSFARLIAVNLGRRIHLFPQTYGPYRAAITKRISRRILRRSATVMSRDHKSFRVIQELFYGRENQMPDITFCPDVAFVLEPRPVDQPVVEPARGLEKPFIGVNISGLLYNGGYTGNNMFGLKLDYKEFSVTLVRTLLDRTGSDVILIPHTYGDMEAANSDPAAIAAVFKRLAPGSGGRLFAVTGSYDQHQIKWIISQASFFMGARMHSCIAALSTGVPTAGIAYSDKFEGVFSSVNCSDSIVDTRHRDIDGAVEQIMELYEKRQEHKTLLERSIPKTKELIKANFESLAERI